MADSRSRGTSRATPGRHPGALAEDAKERVLEDIIQCRLRPGEMLQLSELARKYGMSKTPVREALTLLQQAGLVEAIPYKGYLVKPIDKDDVDDVFLMRELLEGAAAERAARRITEEDLERLDALQAPETMVMTLEYDRYAQTFHYIIAQATRSPRLAQQILSVYTDVRRLQYAGVGRPRPAVITYEHKEIVSALRARDPEAAGKAMVTHIQNIHQRAMGD
jgi:DNA-binding GntR family transcriptional regulator